MFVPGKQYFFILSICFGIYSQNNSTLYKINFNGGRPSVDTIPDTTYYQSENFQEKEKIYSITHYNSDKTVKQYTTYLISGDTNYYCLYEYVGTQCIKETYYNSKNQLTGYAVYTNNSFGGKNYTYFSKDSVQLYEIQYDSALSAYDSSWQYRVYTVRTANNAIYSKKFYQYSVTGWLEKEIYLDYENDTSAIGIWEYQPKNGNTLYTYTLKNGKYLKGKIPDDVYNKYICYYHDSNKNADSCMLCKQGDTLYTIKYTYDSKGWLKQEKYFNKAKIPVYRGEYTFDKNTLTTLYSFYKEPSMLLNQYKTDYRGLGIEFQQYNTEGKLQNSIKYGYNEGLYWDTVSTYDPTGMLISFETYSYYTPYYLIKSDSTFDSQKNVVSYYNYDEFGNVKDSMVADAIKFDRKSSIVFNNKISFRNNAIIIRSYQNAQLNLKIFDVSGKMLCDVTRVLSGFRTVLSLESLLNENAYGNYVFKANIDSNNYSGLFRYNH